MALMRFLVCACCESEGLNDRSYPITRSFIIENYNQLLARYLVFNARLTKNVNSLRNDLERAKGPLI